jgi:hypothetical protein
MTKCAVLVVVAACGFQPAQLSGGDDNGPVDARPDAAIDAPPNVAPPCYVPNRTGLVLCLELDDDPGAQAKDGSGRGHDASVANVAMVTRDVPASSQAGRIITSSTIQADTTPDFDVQQFTLELWVHREGTPNSGGLYGLIHNRAQYYMAIDPNDDLECVIETGNNFTIATGPFVGSGEWDFVACTYDGTSLCPYVVSATGSVQTGSCVDNAITLNTGSPSGISIGSVTQSGTTHIDHLAGVLDSVRVYSRPLAMHELCQGAGVTGC